MSNLPKNWQLSAISPLAETDTSVVFRATHHTYGAVVVKRLKPYGHEEMQGVSFLQWLDGVGGARIYDVQDQDILMEFVPGQTLGELARSGNDNHATKIAGSVIDKIHQRPTQKIGLRPLEVQFESLLNHPEIWPYETYEYFECAATLARRLLQSTANPRPLHGDFHHDNILESTRGWLVIDPKGLHGDPCYDLANFFLNPVGSPETVSNLDRVNHVADHFSLSLGWDRSRILGWAYAHCALSACWHIQNESAYSFNLTMLPILRTSYLANPLT